MKTALLTLALCIAMPAMAEDHLCVSVEEVARTVMQARQRGASMSKVMDATLKIPDRAVVEYARGIVLSAYDVPHFSTDANKRTAADDHGNEWAARCWKRNK